MDNINAAAEAERQRKERASAVDRFFAELPAETKLSDASVGLVLSLLEHPGFKFLSGLLKGERNGLLVALAHQPLDEPAAIAAASVLQGRVQGIDTLHTTLLEVANSSLTPAKENNQ